MKTDQCPSTLDLINFNKNKDINIEKHLIHCDKCLNTLIYLNKNKNEIKNIENGNKYNKIPTGIAASFILFISLFFIFNKEGNINNTPLYSENKNQNKSEINYYLSYMSDFDEEYDLIISSEDEKIINNLTDFKNDIFTEINI